MMKVDSKHNKEYFLHLQELYFEAETNEEQERELMQFVAGTDHEDFRELKAVMGFAVAEKKAHVSKKVMKISRKTLKYAAAAVVVLVVGVGTFMHFTDEPECVAYVHGKKVTDKAVIVQLVNSNVENMRTENIAEAQLKEMLMGL